MGRAYSDLTFTPAVRAFQARMGSREQYAFLDEATDRGDTLTAREVAFIKAADHFFQATVSENGWPYVQHRGGPKGFLKVLDSKTIAFADFRGNVQYQSVGNLLGNDRISIIVVDYPNRRRLKLLGRVQLVETGEGGDGVISAVRDPAYAAAVERAFVIKIEGWDWNCPQHITPRFTEAEVATLVQPLQAQVQQLRAKLAASQVAAKPSVLGDGPLALKIVGVRELTPRVRAYSLASATGAPLPPVLAGAHIDVPLLLADGTPSTRCYSIASNPARTDIYEIAVQVEPEGKGGSQAVHRDFTLGLRLNCSRPRNSFALSAQAQRAVLIAGGIGITPIKAMAHELLARGTDFELHYASRSRGEASFLAELIEAFGDRVHVHAGDEGRRLNVPMLMASLGVDDEVYVCGPQTLVDEVHATARANGLRESRIHSERFVAAPAGAAAAERAITVHLARTGKDVHVPAQTSILDALEAQGVRVPASCRIGNCGTCATRVLSGTPLHRDEVLTSEQKAAQGLMCVCVSRAEGAEITLDL